METSLIGLSQLLKTVAKLWLVEYSVPQIWAFLTDQWELCHRFEQLWKTIQNCFHKFESILSVTYLVKSDKKGLPSIAIVNVLPQNPSQLLLFIYRRANSPKNVSNVHFLLSCTCYWGGCRSLLTICQLNQLFSNSEGAMLFSCIPYVHCTHLQPNSFFAL